MDKLSVGDITFLLFVIPGFLVVWTFRYFSKAKIQGEFEYLGLSFVWGMILFFIVAVLSYFVKPFQNFFKNDIGASFSLVIFAPLLGWFGSFFPTWKWYKRLIDIFRPKN